MYFLSAATADFLDFLSASVDDFLDFLSSVTADFLSVSQADARNEKQQQQLEQLRKDLGAVDMMTTPSTGQGGWVFQNKIPIKLLKKNVFQRQILVSFSILWKMFSF